MEATNVNVMEQIINAIEATNATVDQLVQQGNELCDDVDNLRATDERLGKDVEGLRSDVEAIRADLDHDIVNIGIDIGKHNAAIAAQASSIAANKGAIAANKEAIASQAKDLADLRAAVAPQANDIADLRSGVAALAKEIADLRAIVQVMQASKDAIEASKDATPSPAASQTTDMAALIARIPKPDAVRTRATAQKEAPVVQKDAAPVVEVPVVEAPPVEPVAPRKAAPRTQATTNAVETRAYARQYMIENGAKVEQLRDPAAIEATVVSDAFAAWLAAR